MDYHQITDFLDKFKKIFSQKEEINNLVLVILKNNINEGINKNNFIIKNNIISIVGSPILKNEIFLKKQKILLEIKQKSPNSNILNIR